MKKFAIILLAAFPLLAACEGLSKEEQKEIACKIAVDDFTESINANLKSTIRDQLNEVISGMQNQLDENGNYYVGHGIYATLDEINDNFRKFEKSVYEQIPSVQELSGKYETLFGGSYADYEFADSTHQDYKDHHEHFDDIFYYCLASANYSLGFNDYIDADHVIEKIAVFFDGRAFIKNGIPDVEEANKVNVHGAKPYCWKVVMKSGECYYVRVFKDVNGKWIGKSHLGTPEFE